jgi:hypothetical protein
MLVGTLMGNSNVVSIRRLDINTSYNFKFTVNNISDAQVCVMELPREFKFMDSSEVEMITSLLMSYFFTAEIFQKSQDAKESDNLGFVPREMIGEVVTLSILKNKRTGFSFEQVVPDSIRGNVGEVAIASSIMDLLDDFEAKLTNSDLKNDSVTL